ncbi:hypothetical protein AALM99_02710 [Lactococcus muris]|uniref:Uncharacterized protein n=2 Tax=Lactococcus TaxID=1357 RepID=A0ABV4D7F4_9LACT
MMFDLVATGMSYTMARGIANAVSMGMNIWTAVSLFSGAFTGVAGIVALLRKYAQRKLWQRFIAA